MAINNDPDIHQNVICANIFVRKDDKYMLIRRSPLKKWLPNTLHPIGGKVELNENPHIAARREVWEEAGIKVKNMKLEAVILEISPVKGDPTNWLIFHFTADYESGEVKQSEEGIFEWHTVEEIKKDKLFPSVRATIDHILNKNDGTVFATIKYDDEKQNIVEIKKDLCVV